MHMPHLGDESQCRAFERELLFCATHPIHLQAFELTYTTGYTYHTAFLSDEFARYAFPREVHMEKLRLESVSGAFFETIRATPDWRWQALRELSVRMSMQPRRKLTCCWDLMRACTEVLKALRVLRVVVDATSVSENDESLLDSHWTPRLSADSDTKDAKGVEVPAQLSAAFAELDALEFDGGYGRLWCALLFDAPRLTNLKLARVPLATLAYCLEHSPLLKHVVAHDLRQNSGTGTTQDFDLPSATSSCLETFVALGAYLEAETFAHFCQQRPRLAHIYAELRLCDRKTFLDVVKSCGRAYRLTLSLPTQICTASSTCETTRTTRAAFMSRNLSAPESSETRHILPRLTRLRLEIGTTDLAADIVDDVICYIRSPALVYLHLSPNLDLQYAAHLGAAFPAVGYARLSFCADDPLEERAVAAPWAKLHTLELIAPDTVDRVRTRLLFEALANTLPKLERLALDPKPRGDAYRNVYLLALRMAGHRYRALHTLSVSASNPYVLADMACAFPSLKRLVHSPMPNAGLDHLLPQHLF
jgi:hypothetical protein